MFKHIILLTLKLLYCSILNHAGDLVLRVCPAACLHTIVHHLGTLTWQAIAISLQPTFREHLELLTQLIAREPTLIGGFHDLSHRLPDLRHDLRSQLSVHNQSRSNIGMIPCFFSSSYRNLRPACVHSVCITTSGIPFERVMSMVRLET